MINLFWVAAGGAIGSSLRYLAGAAAVRMLGTAFPWGTLFVNVVGSLLIGAFFAWLSTRPGVSKEVFYFAATGVLGGFTTFSTFSLEVVEMLERGALANALSYIGVSIVISLLAVFIGLWFGRSFL